MSLGCNCDAGLSNTGRPACIPIQSVTSTMIMVPLKTSAGTLNGLDLTASIPVWNDLINATDESARWFPLPQFENVELPKADSQFEEANSGRMAFLRQGKRSFTGELWAEDSSPQLLSKLQNNRCVDFGVYIIDVNGNLVGSKDGDYLYPIPVDNPSFNPTYMFATDSTISKIMLSFDFDRLFDEGTMYMVTPEEAGINFNDLSGLIDVTFADVVEVANASITFNAEFIYGTAYNPLLLKGLVPADFELYNNTDSISETIAGVIENVPLEGNYTLSFAFVTGKSYTASISKDGFDGEYTFTAS